MADAVLLDTPYCDTHRHVCGVDVQRLYRSKKKLQNRILCGQILEEDATIVKFSEVLYSSLIERNCKNTDVVQQRMSGTKTLLEGIEKDGEINLPVTEEKKEQGKLTGKLTQIKCFVCQKYLKADGSVCYRDTSYWCKHCQMPLCNKDRRQPGLGRELTCEGEHICPSTHVFGCSGKAEIGFHLVVPKEEHVKLHPCRSGRSAPTSPASKRRKTIPSQAPAPSSPRRAARAARAVPEPEVQQQIASPASCWELNPGPREG
jgi:hypothetical protein